MGRRLTAGEDALARRVFGDAVVLERVRIRGGAWPFALTIGSSVFFPRPLWTPEFATETLPSQALFIHELVHVWQFQTRPWWTLASWATALLSGGYGGGLRAYRYDLPFGDFTALNLEQQASVVEHAFLLRCGVRAPGLPWGAAPSDFAGAPFPRDL